MAVTTKLEPPPQAVEDVNDWQWRNWFNSLSLISNKYKQPDFIAPTSIAIQNSDGTIDSGDVDSLKTMHDGDVLDISEVTGSPGIDLHINFTNVRELYGMVLRAFYDGRVANHYIDATLYDYVNSSDDSFTLIPLTDSYSYRTVLIGPDIANNYIDSNNNVQMSLIHPTTGNVTHNVHLDYVALLGQRK